MVLDRAIGPFGEAALALAAARPGERVLDVGCGCGDSTLALANAVGASGNVVGVDVSARMLERARERTAELPNVELIEADAAQLEPGPRFDLIYSRFGVMFFADPVAAFTRLCATLVPNGRFAFVCWRAFEDNAWSYVPADAIRRVISDAPALDQPGAPGPFAFADRGKLEQMLLAAGLRSVRIAPFDTQFVLSTSGVDDAVAFAMKAGPGSRLLAGASPEARERVRIELIAALEPHRSVHGVALGGASWIVSARGPG